MPKRLHYANQLLNRIPATELAIFEHELEPIELTFKETLYEQGEAIKHVVFPNSGVISLLTLMRDPKATIEIGTVGREGFVGVPALLGVSIAPGRALCQVPGEGLQLDVQPFREAVKRSEQFRDILLLYTHALLAMVSQTAACNRAHTVEARLARWLLMTHDRVGTPVFPLTQEFLGQMLGVHRPAINLAGQALQKAGLISYTRGTIQILDRRGLEDASCECYGHITEEFARVLGKD